MMGSHNEQDPLFSFNVSLEKRVRADHPLRAVRDAVDFSFVRAEVAQFYGVRGNPSVDPEIIMKLMFLLFFDNITSERALMEMLPERLDYLWFLGYGLDDRIPNHSVLSKARARWGVEVFEELFARTVAQCVIAGLVDGTKLHIDGTLVDANASLDRLTQGPSSLVSTLRETLGRESAKLDEPGPSTPQPPSSSTRVNMTDPDAAVVYRKGKGTKMRYKEHRAVDDAHGVITATITTAGDIVEESQTMVLVEEHERTTDCTVEVIVADCGYGKINTYRECSRRKITCHAGDYAAKNGRLHQGVYSADAFCYDEATDTYSCPAGATLRRRCYDRNRQRATYYADKAVCASCPMRVQCTKSKTSARQIKRYFDQPLIDRARCQTQTRQAKRDRRRRKHLMEGSFADGANNHGLKRARWRGLANQAIQGSLIAACQNIRILLSRRHRPFRKAQTIALATIEPAQTHLHRPVSTTLSKLIQRTAIVPWRQHTPTGTNMPW